MRSTISDSELAWAAGFFDGEGSINFSGRRWKRLVMAVSQTNREPLERFLDAVGGGKIYGPYSRGQATREVYQWQAAAVQAVECMEKLMPYLCSIKATAYHDALVAMALDKDQPGKRLNKRFNIA